MSCELKAWYPNKRDAEAALTSVRARRVGDPWRLPVRAYSCDECTGWHLTSKPLREGSR